MELSELTLEGALLSLGFPSPTASMLTVALVAGVVVQLNERVKGRSPRPEVDGWAWQWLWRAMPALEGALLGLLVAALGMMSPAAGVLLGIIGGVWAVPLWHLLRAYLPGLLKGGKR